MDKKKCANAKICERCGHIAVCGENYCMFCGLKLKNKLVFLVQRQDDDWIVTRHCGR